MVARVVKETLAVAPHGSADRCPGALHAIAADDGALVRVRVPGGYVGVAALRALATLAARYADGSLDITARANVQLRGLREADLPALAAGLEAAGLLPSRAHERVRNIVANPFAGADPGERIDVRPLVRALDRAIVADPLLAALPPKFLFAIDGGGRSVDSRAADICAQATPAAGLVRFVVAAGADARTSDVDAQDVVAVMLAFARHACSRGERIRGAAQLARPPAHGNTVPGIIDSVAPDRINLIPSIRLARLHAAQAHVLADVADAGAADVRFTPWRGIAITDFPRAALARARAALQAADMPLDARDGFAGIAACAGSGACDAARADVRSDAFAYAALVAGSSAAHRTLNLAGCEKRCGMRRGADADLVAMSNGYDVWLQGERVATALAGPAALATVARARVGP